MKILSLRPNNTDQIVVMILCLGVGESMTEDCHFNDIQVDQCLFFMRQFALEEQIKSHGSRATFHEK